MDNSAFSIWRDDEGQQSHDSADARRAPHDLFESSAGRVEPAPLEGQEVALWRTDEALPPVGPSTPEQPPPLPPPPQGKRPESKAKARLVSWRIVLPTTLLLLFLALAADATLALLAIRDGMRSTARRLDQVEGQLGSGNLGEAASLVERSLEELGSVEAATRRPSLILASFIPEVQVEAEAVDGAVDAATLAVRAAAAIVDGASALGLDSEGVPQALYAEGEVQLPAMAGAREQLNEAELALVDAVIRLEALQPRLSYVADPVEQAHARINSVLTRVTDARTTMDLLPPLLGDDGDRRYLLAFQAPGEARGTGGLVGLVGVLKASEGQLELTRVAPATGLLGDVAKPVEAPPWFVESYSSQQALVQFQQANVSPNFPVVSEVLLNMYKETTGTALDGVLAMDPIALSHLMKGMSPIETTQPKMVIDENNVADTLLLSSYTELPEGNAQNVFLEEIVDEFWRRISEGDADLRAVAEGLGEGLRTEHIKLYSRDGREQNLIEDLDLDGNYTEGPNTQMVFNVNYLPNKIDYFLRRDLDTQVKLQSNGDAVVTTTVGLENDAPEGPASILLGSGEQLPVGTNQMTLNLLAPPGSTFGDVSVGGEERSPFIYVDGDSPVAWDVVVIPSGEQRTMTFSYTIPNAIQILGDNTSFDFTLYPQATVNPDSVSLEITPPPGVDVVGLAGGLTDEERPSLETTMNEPISVRLVMDAR